MNSTDGINPASSFSAERGSPAARNEARKLPKTAEEYVEIENRLAAHRDKPQPTAQLNSIFDQLRNRLPR